MYIQVSDWMGYKCREGNVQVHKVKSRKSEQVRQWMDLEHCLH
jgi:hypothetical protein